MFPSGSNGSCDVFGQWKYLVLVQNLSLNFVLRPTVWTNGSLANSERIHFAVFLFCARQRVRVDSLQEKISSPLSFPCKHDSWPGSPPTCPPEARLAPGTWLGGSRRTWHLHFCRLFAACFGRLLPSSVFLYQETMPGIASSPCVVLCCAVVVVFFFVFFPRSSCHASAGAPLRFGRWVPHLCHGCSRGASQMLAVR